MSKHGGNAHGKHYTEDEREDDAERNHNQARGRQHFDETDETQKAGGHSDRHASGGEGQMHEFRREKNDDDEHHHDQAQSEGGMQGENRNAGGHQGGRNQP